MVMYGVLCICQGLLNGSAIPSLCVSHWYRHVYGMLKLLIIPLDLVRYQTLSSRLC
jgi:hypothetical protein